MNWAVVESILIVVGYLIPVVALFIVPTNRKPTAATAWLLVMFILPYIGLLVFLVIGSPKLPRWRRAQQRTMDRRIEAQTERLKELPGTALMINPPTPPQFVPLTQLAANLGGMPVLDGNGVELLDDYPEILRRIAAAIEEAKRFVHVEYYALSSDDETAGVFDALERAQQRGVKVRVLLDQFGSHNYRFYDETRERLSRAGIEWHLMLPLRPAHGELARPDLRNHRKIVVIDGAVGFTGSQNLIRRNYFRSDKIYYDELVALVRGPVAMELNAVFLTDWYAESGVLLDEQTAPEMLVIPSAGGDALCQVLPSGSGFDDENNLKLFTSLIHAAHRKLVVTNPYFVPDESLMVAITSAAQRGVDVSLINSEVSDQFFVSRAQRSYYEQLMRAGVKVYWYRAPVLLHSKCMSIDDDIAVIGSSNLDMRSFQLNMEVTLLVYDRETVARLREIETGYLARSKLLHLEEWEARSLPGRLAENICRLTSALQ
ncbi:MAG TPA: cardiolipin synthase [Ktedonobacterales bacterium]